MQVYDVSVEKQADTIKHTLQVPIPLPAFSQFNKFL